MALISSGLVEIKKYTDFDPIALSLIRIFAHSGSDGNIGTSTIQQLVDFVVPMVSAIGASSYVPTTGTVLPTATSTAAFTFVGPGTYTQTTGGNIVTTALLTLLSRNSTTWSITKEIVILADRSITGIKIGLGTILPENTSFIGKSPQIFDRTSMVTIGSIISSSTGLPVAEVGSAFATIPVDSVNNGYIAVNRGNSTIAASDAPFNFYNSGGTKISTSANNPAVIPGGTTIVKINVTRSEANQDAAFKSLMVQYGNALPTIYYPYYGTAKLGGMYMPKRSQLVSGKLWRAVGDSITAAVTIAGLYGYVARVADGLALSATNKGDNGATIANVVGRSCMSGTLLTYQFDPNTAIVTIFGGVNDFLQNVPIGNNIDADNSTVKGSLIVAINWLETNYPNCKLLLLTPIERGVDTTNTLGLKLIDYRNAIVEIANIRNKPFVDLFYNNEINQGTQAKYLIDQLHPNNGGYTVISPSIENKILDMLLA